MHLIVGLGNPGREYAQTRHNVGFMVLARLAQRHGLDAVSVKTRFHSQTIEGMIQGHKVLLLTPMTYMNRSGMAVAEAARFYKVPMEKMLVVVDDVALPCGRLRLRGEGSAGGHNGLLDIERALGGANFPRLRIGIDSPGRIAQRDYVLGKFTPQQWELVAPAIDRACECIESWLEHDLERTMSLFNANTS